MLDDIKLTFINNLKQIETFSIIISYNKTEILDTTLSLRNAYRSSSFCDAI